MVEGMSVLALRLLQVVEDVLGDGRLKLLEDGVQTAELPLPHLDLVQRAGLRTEVLEQVLDRVVTQHALETDHKMCAGGTVG